MHKVQHYRSLFNISFNNGAAQPWLDLGTMHEMMTASDLSQERNYNNLELSFHPTEKCLKRIISAEIFVANNLIMVDMIDQKELPFNFFIVTFYTLH